jgi:predicted nucleic acid-binding protein
MVVIADTSPLNYLVLIGHADVLPSLYGEVVIPGAVLEELLHPNTPPLVASWIASRPSWLAVEQNAGPLPGSTVTALDPGEQAARLPQRSCSI